MKYYNLTKGNSFDEKILFKVSEKSFKIAKRMAKLSRQHAKLDKQFIEELAQVNNLETFEISDLLADYDFFVDMTEYGNNLDGYAEMREITKEEYMRLINEEHRQNNGLNRRRNNGKKREYKGF